MPLPFRPRINLRRLITPTVGRTSTGTELPAHQHKPPVASPRRTATVMLTSRSAHSKKKRLRKLSQQSRRRNRATR